MNTFYCFDCGSDLSGMGKILFCPNCGVSFQAADISGSSYETETPQSGSSLPGLEGNQSVYFSEGILMTNISRLSRKLNCYEAKVRDLLEKYINELCYSGHQYHLLDAGEIFHPTREYDVQEYVKWLEDFHITKNRKPRFLFIIGCNEIIPMASITNEPKCYYSDDTIESDIAYSYLLSDNLEERIWSGAVFERSATFLTGRLPIPNVSDLNYLERYLNNSKQIIHEGIGASTFFGLSAKSWEEASDETIRAIEAPKTVLTSPDYDLSTIHEVFDSKASFYYFNLHGSESPFQSEYFGDYDSVISPEQMSAIERCNVVLSEACYGAKFVEYDSGDSMLLSALSNKTVNFVGSSKVAFGSSTDEISSADVISKAFFDAITVGKSSGESFEFARQVVFHESLEHLFDYSVTTAVEFNLFGDPFCAPTRSSSEIELARYEGLRRSRPRKRVIYSDDVSEGLLAQVRGIIDDTLIGIRDRLNEELYQKTGVFPRFSSIFELITMNGQKSYNFVYESQTQSGGLKLYSVFTDVNGHIQSILQSK